MEVETSGIFDVIKSGDLHTLQSMIADDPNKLNQKNHNNRSIFHSSCTHGHIDMAQWIFSIDPDQIHIKNIDDCTPFYGSCYNGHINMAQWIYSIDPSKICEKDEDGCTPFYVSCHMGHINVAQWIYSIDPSQLRKKEENDHTPFHLACHNEQMDVAKWLIDTDIKVINDLLDGEDWKTIPNDPHFIIELDNYITDKEVQKCEKYDEMVDLIRDLQQQLSILKGTKQKMTDDVDESSYRRKISKKY